MVTDETQHVKMATCVIRRGVGHPDNLFYLIGTVRGIETLDMSPKLKTTGSHDWANSVCSKDSC